jgi:hypothetical protein
MLRKSLPLAVLAAFCSFFLSCTKTTPETQEQHDLSLYTGIRNIASLGDSESQMLQRSKRSSEKHLINDKEGMDKLRISHYYSFKELGTVVYFRGGHVAMITAQEPFRGTIQGKSIKLFSFSPPPGKTWGETLSRELGEPTARASGGKFGAEALFYTWGDISYNKMGPNQIALYRDTDLSHYRLKNFGRDLKFFAN